MRSLLLGFVLKTLAATGQAAGPAPPNARPAPNNKTTGCRCCRCGAALLPPSGAGTQLAWWSNTQKCRSPSASSQMRLVVLFDFFGVFSRFFQHVEIKSKEINLN
jgi:hypothetical protein